ncbi:MAG: AGE family epimerase/isomerase [Pseudomonadales bacterium]|nr:AGE family epimerase/isomerase [Pseudomonadales bacterium]MDP6469689.1 AGE family epimerase/isomerase [Pseudomonadales bacterium]MDP6828930.1 AGE family epimerase/isomerase [Pseudomonadales bacterium]MDP6972730.1 AGE family epimerase/isomerase [Pseudomonadales bacterium]
MSQYDSHLHTPSNAPYAFTKNVAAQATVLTALSEYALTSADPGARYHADQFFDRLRQHCNDETGYLELTRLIARAVSQLGGQPQRYREIIEAVFCNAVASGMDHDRGGFFHSDIISGGVSDPEKVWRVQAEALLCSLYLYRCFGKGQYAFCFNRTLDWIYRYQADWTHGEWFEYVDLDAVPHGVKASVHKATFQTRRAVLDCLELLDELLDDVESS